MSVFGFQLIHSCINNNLFPIPSMPTFDKSNIAEGAAQQFLGEGNQRDRYEP